MYVQFVQTQKPKCFSLSFYQMNMVYFWNWKRIGCRSQHRVWVYVLWGWRCGGAAPLGCCALPGAPRTSVPAYCCHNRCLQHGLGRYMQWAGSLGAPTVLLLRGPTALAHQLCRAVDSTSSLMAVPATAVGKAHASPHGQHCGCLVHQPVGRYTITPHVTARPPSPSLESHAVQVTAQSCGRRALVDLFASHESSHCQRYFSLTEGPLGTDALAPQLASGFMQVCVSPSEPTRTGTVQAQGFAGFAGCAALAQPDLVSRTHFPRYSTSLAHSSEEGPSSLRGSTPYGTRVQICGISMCGS